MQRRIELESKMLTSVRVSNDLCESRCWRLSRGTCSTRVNDVEAKEDKSLIDGSSSADSHGSSRPSC